MSTERTDVVFGAKIQDLLTGMKEATNSVAEATESMKAHVETLTATVESVKVPFIALLAVLAGGEMFKESIEKTAELGVQLEIMAQKTGMGVEQLSALRYAADLSHVSSEQLTIGLQKLARSMEAAAMGTGPAADAFERLGVSATTADGHLRPMQDVVLQLADRFHNMEDGAGKTALAMDLFGRSGAALIPFLNRGAEGIAALEAEAKKLGITMDEQGVQTAVEYEDAMKRVHYILGAVERDIVLALMPALTQIGAAFAEATGGARAFSKVGEALGDIMKGVAIVMLNVKLAISEAGAAWTAFRGDGVKALQDLKQAWTEYDAAFAALNAPPKHTSIASEAGGETAPPVAGGADVLRQMQLEWDREKVANAQHFGSLTAMERDFWRAKLAMVDADSKEYAQIYQRIASLTEQVDREAYAGQLAKARIQEELDKDNLAQVVEDRKAELAIIRGHYGEASKEVQEGLRRIAEAEHAMHKASAKEWEQAFNAIPAAFSKSVQGIGTQIFTLRDLFRSFFADLTQMGIAAGAASLRNHIAVELAKKNVTVASVAQRVAAETWGAVQSVALGAWAAVKNIANYAAQAIAAAWAAIAAIPVVGPFLAPAVAAGTGVAVLGLAGSIKSAAGGYDIPAGINPVTQLHAQEMVLPAKYADMIRGMADGGSSGGTTTVHIHAMDAQSFVQFAKANPDAFGHGVAGAIGMNHGALGKALRTRGS